MFEYFLIALFLLILAYCFFINRSYSKYLPKKVANPCEKQPHLECPYRVTFKGKVMSTEGHFKCCKIVDQVKAMNKAFCQMVPGKTYNGTSITEHVKQAALRNQKKLEELDSSGPIGYKSKET